MRSVFTSCRMQDRLSAMEFVRSCSGIDKQKAPPHKRSTFMVLNATAEEMAAKLAELQASPRAATP